MPKSFSKLDDALKDLIEAYNEVEEALEEKHGDDDEALSRALLEAVETSIESAMEEHDCSSSSFANVLSVLTESLEQLDPSAFEDTDEEFEEGDDDDLDLDEDDIDDEDLEDLDDDDYEEEDEE